MNVLKDTIEKTLTECNRNRAHGIASRSVIENDTTDHTMPEISTIMADQTANQITAVTVNVSQKEK